MKWKVLLSFFLLFWFCCIFFFLHSHRRRFADVFLPRMHLRREAKSKYCAFIAKNIMPARVCALPENGSAWRDCYILTLFPARSSTKTSRLFRSDFITSTYSSQNNSKLVFRPRGKGEVPPFCNGKKAAATLVSEFAPLDNPVLHKLTVRNWATSAFFYRMSRRKQAKPRSLKGK